MFFAVVNRYFERQVHEHETLGQALAEAQSDECFFIGVIDSDTDTVYIPEVTAIGFSDQQAVQQITEATGRQAAKIIKFGLHFCQETSTVPSPKM